MGGGAWCCVLDLWQPQSMGSPPLQAVSFLGVVAQEAVESQSGGHLLQDGLPFLLSLCRWERKSRALGRSPGSPAAGIVGLGLGLAGQAGTGLLVTGRNLKPFLQHTPGP